LGQGGGCEIRPGIWSWFVAVALLAIFATGQGCSRVKLPAAPIGPPFQELTLRPGYAYPAELATAHPLYPELRRLDETLTRLRRVSEPQNVPEPQAATADSFLTAPSAPAYPSDLWSRHVADWRAGVEPLQPPDTSVLTDDLQVILNWRARELEEKLETEMHAAEAEEGRKLAALRIAAVRRRQEELSNLGLRNLDMDDVQALANADEAAKKIWAEIDAEYRAAKAKSDQALATLRERKHSAAVASLAEYEQGLRNTMAERVRSAVSAGHEDRAAMEAAVKGMAPGIVATGPVATYASTADAAVDRALAATRLVRAVYNQTRDRQIQELARRRADLANQIMDATDATARAVAFEQGIELHLLPGDEAVGSNVTEIVRSALLRRWTQFS